MKLFKLEEKKHNNARRINRKLAVNSGNRSESKKEGRI
jgi:protein subunit release factor A